MALDVEPIKKVFSRDCEPTRKLYDGFGYGTNPVAVGLLGNFIMAFDIRPIQEIFSTDCGYTGKITIASNKQPSDVLMLVKVYLLSL